MFKDKTVIITGASAGVGAACARAFANNGANLVLVARGQAALDAIKAELSDKVKVLTVAMDVADSTACRRLIEQAVAEFGGLHVLVNNAGTHFRGNVTSRTSQELAAMADVNFRAPIQLTAGALPHIQKEGGAVVMVGSLAGRAPLQGAATYSATKAGLRTFTHALADELRGSNVNVGVVSPGPIDTGFIMDDIDQVEDIVYSQPMSSAQQVAEAVLKIARGEEVEIAMPALSGKLTTLSYLFPGLRRAARPILYKIGKKNKNKYRNR
jgi:short-subunit dehydrogenase